MTWITSVLCATQRLHSERITLAMLSMVGVALLVFAYFILVVPNAAYVDVWLNDVMGLTDAAYRVFTGQVPSVDFRSLYGAAIYYPTALGFHLGYSAGGVLGFGHFFTAVPLLVITVLASYRRFPIVPSCILILFLFALIVIPMRLGESVVQLTYALYYTRHGWAALTIMLLFYLEPRIARRSDYFVDSTLLALLLLYLCYTKITFVVLGIGFLAVNSMTSKYNMRVSFTSALVTVLFVSMMSLFGDYQSAYPNDILDVVTNNPALRAAPRDLLLVIYQHAWILILCFAALAAAYLVGRRKFFDLAFLVGCIAANLIVLDQSGGVERGMPAMIAVLLVFGELTRRAESVPDERAEALPYPRYIASISILGMLLAFASEPAAQVRIAIPKYFHNTGGERPTTSMPEFGLYTPRQSALSLHEVLGHDDEAHARLNALRAARRPALGAGAYLDLLKEGVELLQGVPHEDHSVINFEQSNPFSVLLRMRPTSYGYPFFWIPREAPVDQLPAAERYFAGADYVMVPVLSHNVFHLEKMMEKYGDYLEDHFDEIRRSLHWRLYARSRGVDSDMASDP